MNPRKLARVTQDIDCEREPVLAGMLEIMKRLKRVKIWKIGGGSAIVKGAFQKASLHQREARGS